MASTFIQVAAGHETIWVDVVTRVDKISGIQCNFQTLQKRTSVLLACVVASVDPLKHKKQILPP
jgi:hypothetical protein